MALVAGWLLGALPLPAAPPRPVRAALDALSPQGLLEHTRILASDAFEGRAPGTAGEEKTVRYLLERFQALGLEPGNPDGTYVQRVPMMGLTAVATAAYRLGGQRTDLRLGEECVLWSMRFTPEVGVADSELVFVGYGVVAPEYHWDDYKGLDVRGKTLVMLINDPPVPDPTDPGKLDPRRFKGRAMTYYGRWTYKYEIAAQKGAAAALIVHETGPAGYPWAVVVGSNTQEHFDLRSPDENAGRAGVEGWLTLETARKLFAAAGLDFEAQKRAAAASNFRPVPLGGHATLRVKNGLREVDSRNVVGLLRGADPKLKNEYIVYTAHWDHLGRNPNLSGDQVYNGALDNASGVAGLLELARAFKQLPTPPRRSVLFLSVTAEEKGLLGARYYALQPLYPLARTIANLNLDGVNPWGRTRDVEVVGFGNSTLEDVLARVAAAQHRVVKPDSEPERGRFFRSDHFEFAKVGVPALYPKSGLEYLGKPAGYGSQKIEAYTAEDYHKVTDEVRPDWDLSGAVEDLRLLFQVGWQVAQTRRRPEWKAQSEFNARGAGAR